MWFSLLSVQSGICRTITEAGLKGVGGVEVSEKHAGFMINSDGTEIEDLISLSLKS